MARWALQHALAGAVIAGVITMPFRPPGPADAVHAIGAGLGLLWFLMVGHRWVRDARRAASPDGG